MEGRDTQNCLTSYLTGNLTKTLETVNVQTIVNLST